MPARRLLFLQAFVVIYILYALTLYPGVAGGDSGELLAEACLLGTPHPPGYPLYTVACALARNLLAGLPRLYLDCSEPVWRLHLDYTPTHAWRVNNLCAVMGSTAAALVALTCYDILCLLGGQVQHGGIAAASLTGAILFALSPLVWEYSITAEVFALNNLLCAAVCYLTIRVYISSKVLRSTTLTSRNLYLGALFSGFCMANQHSSLLLLVVLVPAALVFAYPLSLHPTTLSVAAMSFFAGMSPYAYLVVSSRSPKPGSWGDTRGVQGLIRHVLRAEYGTFQLGIKAGSETFVQRVVLYLKHASQETFHLVFPLAILGIFYAWQAGQQPVAAAITTTGGSTLSRKQHRNLQRGAREAAVAVAASQDEVYSATTGKGGGATVLVLTSAWLFYLLAWHGVLSNLPLDSPMPYGVHARFW